MADLFEDYRLGNAWDEMLGGPDEARGPYRAVHHTLRSMRPEALRERAEYLARSFLDQGVTFDHAGEERPFPLDAVPRVISADEWAVVEAGVEQRVRALEAFLADVYNHPEDLPTAVKQGIIPWELITSSAHYHRAVHGIRPANDVRAHVSGIDLIRDEGGTFRVLEDNVRVPSGVSYVMANRRAMTNVFPEAFATLRIRPVHEYPRMLLSALRAAAPDGASDPTVVVLTPGVFNSAYFEHTLLARMMGVELVEGRDLICSGGVVKMRTTQGEQPIDVIYRRIDDEYLDPVHFRPDSILGVTGLVAAIRAGRVSVANAIGNGVADDKLIYSYVPHLTRHYLDEDPILPNVDTYRCTEPAALAHVLEHLDEMVVKPVDGSGGKGLVIGPAADGATLDALRHRLVDDPRGWIAQPVVQLSTVPTLIGGRLAPRHVDLRPFAVNDGTTVRVLPGGLTRVALPEGQLVVNSSQGGGSKDTWVLSNNRGSSQTRRDAQRDAREIVVMTAPDTAQEDAAGTQQQQQQQQQLRHVGVVAGNDPDLVQQVGHVGVVAGGDPDLVQQVGHVGVVAGADPDLVQQLGHVGVVAGGDPDLVQQLEHVGVVAGDDPDLVPQLGHVGVVAGNDPDLVPQLGHVGVVAGNDPDLVPQVGHVGVVAGNDPDLVPQLGHVGVMAGDDPDRAQQLQHVWETAEADASPRARDGDRSC